jgi:type II secretory pathway component PulJ
MQLDVVDLMAFMLFSQIAIAALVLYSFLDQEREARRRTNAVFAQLEKLMAELEKRIAAGSFRSPDELDRLIAASSAQPAAAGKPAPMRAGPRPA